MSSAVNVAAARSFVQSIELEDLKISHLQALRAEPINYDASQNQALIVGSDVVSFVTGVTAETRQDIANSALLAQLVAKKKVSDPARIYDWYQEYFDALAHLGWIIQARSFTEYSTASDEADVHRVILDLAETLLGSGAAALAIIKSVLDTLKTASLNSPWITVFDRESRHANAAKFQITLADKGQSDEVPVSLMAFGLEAQTTITQVLFFKFQASQATLKKYSGIITVDTAVLSSVRQMIADKLAALTNNYIKQLPDLS